MIKITMEDIINDLAFEKEENAYYWDDLNENGYHVHVFPNNALVCMKAVRKRISVITAADFIEAVNNKCYGNAISENAYYESLHY